MVTVGRFCSDSSGYNYNGEGDFSSDDRLGQILYNFVKANNPTLKCPTTTESYGGSYRLKAGLITADELVLAGESSSVESNGYLSDAFKYYTMTPARFYLIQSDVWIFASFLSLDYVILEFGVRPVINVTTDSGFTSGDGSASSPYVIQ